MTSRTFFQFDLDVFARSVADEHAMFRAVFAHETQQNTNVLHRSRFAFKYNNKTGYYKTLIQIILLSLSSTKIFHKTTVRTVP